MKLTVAMFERLIIGALDTFKKKEPKHTGNMADTATKTDIGTFEAKIFIDPEDAPYYKYTEFPWAETSPVIVNAPNRPSLLGKSSFLWNDGDKPYGTPKQNPNEGWTKPGMKAVAEYVAARVGGEIKEWRIE